MLNKFELVVLELKELTENNNHSAAYDVGLTYLVDYFYDVTCGIVHSNATEKLVEMRRIRALHAELCELPFDLYLARNLCYNYMIEFARKILSEDDFKTFYDCF